MLRASTAVLVIALAVGACGDDEPGGPEGQSENRT